jgi:hypothetical protein
VNPAHKGIKPGDRIWYENSHGQEFYAWVESIHGRHLIVKRDEWYARECIDLNDYIRSRHFPAGKEVPS